MILTGLYKYNADITHACDLINKIRRLLSTDMYEVLIPTANEAMNMLEGINKSLIEGTDNIYTVLTKSRLKISFVNDTDQISKLIDVAVKIKVAVLYEKSIPAIDEAAVMLDRIVQSSKKYGVTDLKKAGRINTKLKKGK